MLFLPRAASPAFPLGNMIPDVVLEPSMRCVWPSAWFAFTVEFLSGMGCGGVSIDLLFFLAWAWVVLLVVNEPKCSSSELVFLYMHMVLALGFHFVVSLAYPSGFTLRHRERFTRVN